MGHNGSSPNGAKRTDHGWEDNTFMIGGQVKGGLINGTYPSDLTLDGTRLLDRGLAIPTPPFYVLCHGLAQGFGFSDLSEMKNILPNSNHLTVPDGTIYEAHHLFNFKTSSSYGDDSLGNASNMVVNFINQGDSTDIYSDFLYIPDLHSNVYSTIALSLSSNLVVLADKIDMFHIPNRKMKLDNFVDPETITYKTYDIAGADLTSLCVKSAFQCIQDKVDFIDIDHEEINADLFARNISVIGDSDLGEGMVVQLYQFMAWAVNMICIWDISKALKWGKVLMQIFTDYMIS